MKHSHFALPLLLAAVLVANGCVLIDWLSQPEEAVQGDILVVSATGQVGSTWGGSYSGWIAVMLPKGCTPESLIYTGVVSGAVYDTSQNIGDTAAFYHSTDPGMDWWGMETSPHTTDGGNYSATLYIKIDHATDPGFFLLDYLTGSSYTGSSWQDSVIDVPLTILPTGIENESVISSRSRIADMTVQPNPAKSTATIRLQIPYEALPPNSRHPGLESFNYSLEVYDISGRLVRNLLIAPASLIVEESTISVVWDGSDNEGRSVGSGVFLLRFQVHKQTITKPIVIIR